MASDLARIIRSVVDGTAVDPEEIRVVLAGDGEAAIALTDLALRVDALRQRSAELRGVMSSTRDLLAIPDADLMLQRIVDRAHELMKVDVTYLSVYEPVRDELYVRAATGTISPRFFGMVVPAGIGVASLAVRTQHPQWVEDYSTHTAVPHDPTIDEVVGEEQLRGLLGAPLVVKGKVLGVLFAATRSPHAFRPDEIALLSAFAAHAALVLHLAQLLRQATDATAEAASRQQEAEWAASLHGELTQLVVDGHDAKAVVGALTEALGREVTLVSDGGVFRSAENDPFADPILRAAAAEAAVSGRSVVIPTGGIELVVSIIAATSRSQAMLIARGEHPLTPVERRTVERSALTAALVMLRSNALADAEEWVRGEVATEVLEGAANRVTGLRRAAARGYPVDQSWVLVALPCDPDERPRLLSRLRIRTDWLVATAPLGVTVLAPELTVREAEGTEALTTAREVGDFAGPGSGLVVASGRASLEEAAVAAPAVWQTVQLARGLGINSGVIDAATLAPYSLLFEGDGGRIAAFVDSMLAPVIAWDSTHGSALLDTLGVLFDERWSLASAARTLHVHLNTVKQRMQRLRALLDEDPDRPEARFRLELAVRIERARLVARQASES